MSDKDTVLTPFAWSHPRSADDQAVFWVDDEFADVNPQNHDIRGPYGVDPGERREKRWLVSPHAPDLWEKYQPLQQHPELFRTFLDVSGDEDGYLSFANKYGTLGIASTLADTTDGHGFSMFGEALYLWRKEQALLRAADRVAGALAKRRGAELETWFVANGKGGYQLAGDLVTPEFLPRGVNVVGRMNLPKSRPAPIWVAHDQIKDPTQQRRLIARVWLARQINDRLQGERGNTSAVSVRVLATGDGAEMPIHQSPNSLLAAIWLQFVESVNANRKFRRCNHCKRWFLLSPEGVGLRRQAKYCGSACRLRAFRAAESKKGKKR